MDERQPHPNDDVKVSVFHPKRRNIEKAYRLAHPTTGPDVVMHTNSLPAPIDTKEELEKLDLAIYHINQKLWGLKD